MNATWGSRDTCTSCGSTDVTHIAYGFPADPDSAPDWVAFAGCVIDGSPDDRRCDACGHAWKSEMPEQNDTNEAVLAAPPSAPRRSALPPKRRALPAPRARAGVWLLSFDAASFALIKVPALEQTPDAFLVDIELLSPDRLVRYLSRPLARDTVAQLSDALLQAAADRFPEQSVSTVEDRAAGLAVQVVESTEFTVALDVLVVTTSEAGIDEPDRLVFDLPRASLIPAAHQLQEWLS